MVRATMMVLALATVGCATRQPPGPPPFDPVGTYSFTTEANGTTVAGTLAIRRVDQALRATLTTGVTGEVAIDNVTHEGRRVEMRSPLQVGELLMSLEFSDNDRYSGSWSLAGRLGGTVSGTRQPPRSG